MAQYWNPIVQKKSWKKIDTDTPFVSKLYSDSNNFFFFFFKPINNLLPLVSKDSSWDIYIIN